MRTPIQPHIDIMQDSVDEIMARSGDLVGYTRSRAVWRFGFLPMSDAARAYGVHTDMFIWVIANRKGKILATYTGFAYTLPRRFNRIIDK